MKFVLAETPDVLRMGSSADGSVIVLATMPSANTTVLARFYP
jgi:hypothetical protein